MLVFLEYLYRKKEQINFYLLLVLFVVVPLIFYVKTQNIVFLKTLSAYFAAYTSFLIYLTTSYYEAGRFKLLPSPINWPIVILLLYLDLNAAITVWRMQWGPPAIEEMANFSSYFLIALMVARYMNNFKKLRFALDVITLVTFLVSFYYFGQVVLQRDFLSEILSMILNKDIYFWGGWAFVPGVSTFGNKNFYCGYVDVTMPICLGLAFATQSFIRLGLYLFTGLLTMYCIYISRTRGAILGMFGSVSLFFILMFVNIKNIEFFKEKYRKWASMSILILAIISLFFMGIKKRGFLAEQFDPLKRLIISVPQVTRGTNLVRIRMWEGAMRMGIDHPILGVGVGGFRAAFPYYRPSHYHRSGVTHNTDHPHDEYLEYLGESGLIGLILWLGLYATIFITGFRLLYRYRKSNYYLVILGIICGLVGELIQNLVCVELRWTGCAVSMWTAIGLLLSFLYLNNGLDDKVKRLKRIRFPKNGMIMLFISIFCVILYFYISHRLLLSDKHLISGMTKLDQETLIDSAIKDCEKSIELNPFEVSGMYKGAFGYLKKNDQQNALRLYKMLTDILPNYAQIHNNIGLVYLNLGQQGLSLSHFERATLIENNYKNHIGLAQRWLQLGYWKKALYHLYRIHLIPHDAENGDAPMIPFYGRSTAYFLESQINIRFRNDLKEAENNLKYAIVFDPFNQSNYLQLVNILAGQNRFEEAYDFIKSGALNFGSLNFDYVILLTKLASQLNKTSELRQYYKIGIMDIEKNFANGQLSNDAKVFLNNFLRFASTLGNVSQDKELIDLIAKSYIFLKDYANAYNFINLALRLEPDNREYKLILERLRMNMSQK
ncbi:MAG: O-antigen ligase family protein [Candidatus Hydrogenedentota bacterium]